MGEIAGESPSASGGEVSTWAKARQSMGPDSTTMWLMGAQTVPPWWVWPAASAPSVCALGQPPCSRGLLLPLLPHSPTSWSEEIIPSPPPHSPRSILPFSSGSFKIRKCLRRNTWYFSLKNLHLIVFNLISNVTNCKEEEDRFKNHLFLLKSRI